MGETMRARESGVEEERGSAGTRRESETEEPMGHVRSQRRGPSSTNSAWGSATQRRKKQGGEKSERQPCKDKCGQLLEGEAALSRATPHGQSHKGKKFSARKTSNSSSVLHYAELLNSRPLGSPPPSPSGAAESCAPVRQHSSVSLLAHRASHGPVIIRLTN